MRLLPFTPLSTPPILGPSFPRIETIPHMNVEVLDWKRENVCCLDRCGHDVSWTWSENGLQGRTRGPHACTAQLNFKLEPYSLACPFCSLYVHFSVSLDRSHTPALTWHLFYSMSTLMYFTRRLSTSFHCCFMCFGRFFTFFGSSSCLWRLCFAFLSSVDDSCHFHFCGECDLWLMWQCFFFITDFYYFFYVIFCCCCKLNLR